MGTWAKQRMAELKAAAPVKRQRRDLFIRVPLKRAEAVCKAVGPQRAFIWALLLHMAWTAHSLTFACHNGLMERYGISRKVKYQALAKLEAAGFITVQWRPRRSPIVTIKP